MIQVNKVNGARNGISWVFRSHGHLVERQNCASVLEKLSIDAKGFDEVQICDISQVYIFVPQLDTTR